jgi:hypothetical protein
MTRFRQAEVWERLSLGEKRRGNAVYSAFQSAYDEALPASHGNGKALTPENVKAVANETVRVFSTIPY